MDNDNCFMAVATSTLGPRTTGGLREPLKEAYGCPGMHGHFYTTTEDHHGSLWTKKPWPSESNNIHLGLYTAPSADPEFHICPRCARRERGS